MNRNQDKGKGKDVAGKMAGDRVAEQKGKAGKHQDKDGAVLGKINDDTSKKKK